MFQPYEVGVVLRLHVGQIATNPSTCTKAINTAVVRKRPTGAIESIGRVFYDFPAGMIAAFGSLCEKITVSWYYPSQDTPKASCGTNAWCW